MLVAYRRMSGAIGVSDDEKGARGLWWEKRRALLKYLELRGHTVEFVNRMTEKSKHIKTGHLRDDHEILIIEFGSSNFVFYGPDLKGTEELVKKFKGKKIIFICDDPDLPYIWKSEIPNMGKWICWYNCIKPQPIGGQPFVIPCLDFPFSSIQDATHSDHFIQTEYEKDKLVYIGRPFGREKAVKELIAHQVPFQPYAKATEWDELGLFVKTPPEQPQRAAFYNRQLGCLVLADSKHKALGWRTGRAFHALLAGCPAVAEYDHQALRFLTTYRQASELQQLVKRWQDPELRHHDWYSQMHGNWYNRTICDKTAEESGL